MGYGIGEYADAPDRTLRNSFTVLWGRIVAFDFLPSASATGPRR
jgi:hypothetical protein